MDLEERALDARRIRDVRVGRALARNMHSPLVARTREILEHRDRAMTSTQVHALALAVEERFESIAAAKR